MEEEKKELINCLRKEKVVVKFIPRPNRRNLPNNHVLKDGKMEGSKDTFSVPIVNGMYAKVLTDDEQAFFENLFGFQPHRMDNSRIEDNYWSDANFENTINSVTLGKTNNVLDLSNAVDYIKYCILKANTETICQSQLEFENNPKPTYKYVILREEQQVSFAKNKVDKIKRAWTEFGKIESDYNMLKYIVEESNVGLKVGASTKIELLQIKVSELIDKDTQKFLDIAVNDKHVKTKVLIKSCAEKLILICKSGFYYIREGEIPLCNAGDNSTLDKAAHFLDEPKNQELKFVLEAKLNGEATAKTIEDITSKIKKK